MSSQQFEFVFDGSVDAAGKVTCGIRIMRGDPVFIGRALGIFAAQALPGRVGQQTSMVFINAWREFKKLNPAMCAAIEKDVAAKDSEGPIIHLK